MAMLNNQRVIIHNMIKYLSSEIKETGWWLVELPLWKMIEFVSWDDDYSQ